MHVDITKYLKYVAFVNANLISWVFLLLPLVIFIHLYDYFHIKNNVNVFMKYRVYNIHLGVIAPIGLYEILRSARPYLLIISFNFM